MVTTGHTAMTINTELTMARFHENAVKVPFDVRAPAAQVPTETPDLANEFAKLSI